MKALACVFALSLAAACAHTPTQVQDLGRGRHALTAMSPSGGYYGSREEAVEQANDFCGKHAQQAVVDGFYDKAEAGAQGEHTSSVFFRCETPPRLQF
jgi:hypothetical protein